MSKTMSKMSDAAVQYARLGYRVFPCRPGGKTPLTPRGFQDASSDLDKVQFWWTAAPNANIGLCTEGLVVIDCDDHSWPAEPDHATTLASAVAVAQTPRGGRHYVFRRPEGVQWRCSASRLAIGVDVRTDGGYIVVAPSVTDRGGYLWLPGHTLSVSREQLTLPPPWLHEALEAVAARTVAVEAVDQAEADNRIPSGSRNVALARLGGAMRRVGMTEAEIAVAIGKINQDRCQPPLGDEEVRRIAASVARYSPDEVATAHAEGWFEQVVSQGAEAGNGNGHGNLSWLYQRGKSEVHHNGSAEDRPTQAATPTATLERGNGETPLVRSLRDMLATYTRMRPPVIEGLLRVGETMNVIAAPKTGKSWLVSDLALAVATGTPWLGLYEVAQGNVLIVDNELHLETITTRLKRVIEARGIDPELVGNHVDILPLRGQLKDIVGLATLFKTIEPGKYKLVIVDAFYRVMPKGMDENDNSTMSQIYNFLDLYAARLQCSFVLIHHTSKGNQSGKAVTDVGAGAGAQSRAADTHFVLRQHEMPGVCVAEAAVRSWPPIEAKCLRWAYPLWQVEHGLNPALLKGEPSRKHKAKTVEEAQERFGQGNLALWFAHKVLTNDWRTTLQVLHTGRRRGLTDKVARQALQEAVNQGYAVKARRENNRVYYKRAASTGDSGQAAE